MTLVRRHEIKPLDVAQVDDAGEVEILAQAQLHCVGPGETVQRVIVVEQRIVASSWRHVSQLQVQAGRRCRRRGAVRRIRRGSGDGQLVVAASLDHAQRIHLRCREARQGVGVARLIIGSAEQVGAGVEGGVLAQTVDGQGRCLGTVAVRHDAVKVERGDLPFRTE